jgi:putative photosynthetic complex assembly protein
VSEIDKEKFPTIALYAAAAIIVISIGAAALGRYNNTRDGLDTAPLQEPVASFVDLQFFDEADGSVSVTNATTKALVITLKPGEDAFIRAVVRGFVRDRNARKISRDIPFRLYRLEDSRLVFEDTSTKKRINLRGFGPTQQAAFARLLPSNSSTPVNAIK